MFDQHRADIIDQVEDGVHDRLRIYTLCGIFSLPWHRHHIKGTFFERHWQSGDMSAYQAVFRLFQCRDFGASWASGYSYANSTSQPPHSSTPGVFRRAPRRGLISDADKRHHYTFPGCSKKFFHETHARRHERTSHSMWRHRRHSDQPRVAPGPLFRVPSTGSNDPPSAIALDGVSRTDLKVVGRTEWHDMASAKDQTCASDALTIPSSDESDTDQVVASDNGHQ